MCDPLSYLRHPFAAAYNPRLLTWLWLQFWRPRGSLMSPWLLGLWFCVPVLVSDLDLASLRFFGYWLCTSYDSHPTFPSTTHQWPLRLLDGPSPFWNFLVGRLSHNIKQHFSLCNSNPRIPTEFFVLQWNYFIYLCRGYSALSPKLSSVYATYNLIIFYIMCMLYNKLYITHAIYKIIWSSFPVSLTCWFQGHLESWKKKR